MIEGQIVTRAAILALETISQENVEAGKGGVFGGLDIVFERNDARQAHLEARTSDHLVIFGNDVHTVQAHGLYGVLPVPKGQWIIAERPEIGVQDKSGTGLR